MRIEIAAFITALAFSAHSLSAGPLSPTKVQRLSDGVSRTVFVVMDKDPISIGNAPLTDCDRYASYSHDHERMTVPVPFDRINSSKALPACTLAVSQYPNSARLEALLGRVLLKAGNLEQSEEWYRKAAKRGHLTGQHSLGRILHAKGDFTEAARWLELAARQGFFASQGLLGDYLAEGRGVPKDMAEAVTWWRLSAEQGDPASQLSLGNAYFNGVGIAQDLAKAVKWYIVASQNNYEPALHRMEWAKNNLPIGTYIEGIRYAQGWKAKTWSEISHLLE